MMKTNFIFSLVEAVEYGRVNFSQCEVFEIGEFSQRHLCHSCEAIRDN